MTLAAFPPLAWDADDCSEQPQRICPALISERSILHLGRKAFSLSGKGLGGADQCLSGQFKLQFVRQGIPLNLTAPGTGDEHGSGPIWPLRR